MILSNGLIHYLDEIWTWAHCRLEDILSTNQHYPFVMIVRPGFQNIMKYLVIIVSDFGSDVAHNLFHDYVDFKITCYYIVSPRLGQECSSISQ